MEEEEEKHEQNTLYPQLPQFYENPQNFRLTQISEVKKFLETEIEFRRKIFSKYKKAFILMLLQDYLIFLKLLV